jgi:hypothetical protein
MNQGDDTGPVDFDVFIEPRGRVTVEFANHEEMARFFRRRDGLEQPTPTIPVYTSVKEFASLIGISERSLAKIKTRLKRGEHYTMQGRRLLFITAPAMAFINQNDLLAKAPSPGEPSDDQAVSGELLRRKARGTTRTSASRRAA